MSVCSPEFDESELKGIVVGRPYADDTAQNGH